MMNDQLNYTKPGLKDEGNSLFMTVMSEDHSNAKVGSQLDCVNPRLADRKRLLSAKDYTLNHVPGSGYTMF